MSRLQFYLIRLQKASALEIAHRILERGRVYFWTKIEPLWTQFVPVPSVASEVLEKLTLPALTRVDDVSMTEQILDGFVWTLGEACAEIQKFEANCRDVPFTDIDLNSLGLDIRAVWEPARLQHIMYLLDVCIREPEHRDIGRIKNFCNQQLSHWIDSNPFLKGPHYLSVMECGLRIPVFVYALKLLNLTEENRTKLLKAIYQHAWLIEQRLSLYSSLGNHTVAEAMGLLVAGSVFGKTVNGKRWSKRGRELVEQECGREILEDGGPLEQSSSYHRFVLDLFTFCHAWMKLNDSEPTSNMKESLLRGESFWQVLSRFDCYPGFGDSDGGWAIAPGLSPERFEPSALVPTHRGDWNVWTFEKTGLTLCEHAASEMMLTLDHGPLGMAPLYNHGHADALSVFISYKNLPYFTDPGTYRYNGVPQYREYFRGTAGHNTVTVDGRDQSQQLTGFVWATDFEVSLEKLEVENDMVKVCAYHCGYTSSNERMVHRRELTLLPDGEVDIYDSFSGSKSHRYALNFHLDPDVKVNSEGKRLLLESQREKLYVGLEQGAFERLKGTREPLRGWYSASYGSICETTTLSHESEGYPDATKFKTQIRRA